MIHQSNLTYFLFSTQGITLQKATIYRHFLEEQIDTKTDTRSNVKSQCKMINQNHFETMPFIIYR